VIVFEDIHWADESSLALFRGVQPWLATAPMLVLATARPSEEQIDAGPGAHVLELHDLSMAASAAMIRAALQKPELPDAIVEAVYEKTRGNPLFTAEVIRELSLPGILDGLLGASSVSLAVGMATLGIPDRVQGLFMSQIDRLSPDTREVVKAASVYGRIFTRTALTGIDDAMVRSSSLGAALAELTASALVEHEPTARGGSYRFRHALVQQVAYDSLPFARRRELHGIIARFIERTSEQPEDGLLVHHYRHADDRPELRVHATRRQHPLRPPTATAKRSTTSTWRWAHPGARAGTRQSAQPSRRNGRGFLSVSRRLRGSHRAISKGSSSLGVATHAACRQRRPRASSDHRRARSARVRTMPQDRPRLGSRPP